MLSGVYTFVLYRVHHYVHMLVIEAVLSDVLLFVIVRSTCSLSALSAYYSTSEPKARLMTRINSQKGFGDNADAIDNDEVTKKKVRISQISG